MCQCRRTSRDTDVASTAGALLSESEASELFGEYIDEDSQTVHHVSIMAVSFYYCHTRYICIADLGEAESGPE